MSDVLPALPLLSAFIGVAIVLAVTPGPGVLYIVTRSATQGPVAGLASVAGVGLGNALSATAASFGLAAAVTASVELFTAIKVAGALYLIFLAVRTVLASKTLVASALSEPTGPWRLVADGTIVAALNPKTALFYAALLPQFVDSPLAAREQALALSAIFVGVAAVSDCLYALLAGASARVVLSRLVGKPLYRYVAAAIYAVLGIVAVTASHSSINGAKTP